MTRGKGRGRRKGVQGCMVVEETCPGVVSTQHNIQAVCYRMVEKERIIMINSKKPKTKTPSRNPN